MYKNPTEWRGRRFDYEVQAKIAESVVQEFGKCIKYPIWLENVYFWVNNISEDELKNMANKVTRGKYHLTCDENDLWRDKLGLPKKKETEWTPTSKHLKRRVPLSDLAGRPVEWWHQGLTHKTIICDLLGGVPDSWETLKLALLKMPENLMVVDYLLECMNEVEDEICDQTWVTLPRLIQP